MTASAIERDDISPENGWLFLEDFKRIEASGFRAYPQAEAVGRVLRALALTPAGEAPAPVAPQPTESADDLITRGIALHAQGKYAEALLLFERAAQLAPGSSSAWSNLGQAFYDLERPSEAVTALERALELDPRNARIWVRMGNSLSDSGQHEEAIAAFDKAIAIDPHDEVALLRKEQELPRFRRESARAIIENKRELQNYDVFLSYDRRDASLVRAIANDLREWGNSSMVRSIGVAAGETMARSA